jgi:hypothetical protein
MLLSKKWIKKNISTKRRYRKGNPGEKSRRNQYPPGYDDHAAHYDDFSDDDSVKPKAKKVKIDKLPKELKKPHRKNTNEKSIDIKENDVVVLRDDDSFLEGFSQSIHTIGTFYIFYVCFI